MFTLLAALLIVVTALLIIPVCVFALECLMAARHPNAASYKPDGHELAQSERPTIAVVIPAHDEEAVIEHTLVALAHELTSGDRVIVVADNCTDGTAKIATRCGALVLQRNDEKNRGKGHALDHAVRFLRAAPPQVVVFIDADCRVSDGAVELLGVLALASGRPVQARNQMNEANGADERSIAGFAWLIRGTVRPIGLAAMNMPCQLYGTGMAFPWMLLQQLSLASSNIVEDMKLTVDLIDRGTMPQFCSDAAVISAFAAAPDAAHAQRRRWEHGHIATLFNYGMPAIARAIRELDLRKTMLALDICVPQLSLLVMLLAVATIASALLIPFLYVARYTTAAYVVAWIALCASLGIASRQFARGAFNLKSLARISVYAASKIPLYLKFMTGRQKEWTRTDRR